MLRSAEVQERQTAHRTMGARRCPVRSLRNPANVGKKKAYFYGMHSQEFFGFNILGLQNLLLCFSSTGFEFELRLP